jgi:hypothetical protein
MKKSIELRTRVIGMTVLVMLAAGMANTASAQLYGGGVKCTVGYLMTLYYLALGVDPSFACY